MTLWPTVRVRAEAATVTLVAAGETLRLSGGLVERSVLEPIEGVYSAISAAGDAAAANDA